MLLKEILFPVDLSADNHKILPFVKELAAKLGGNLHVLNVVEDIEGYASFYVPHTSLDKLSGEVVNAASQKLSEFAAQHLADMGHITTKVVMGDPARLIVDYVKENGIQVVVMGTHGRTGLEHVIFGSVAEKVVKNSPVPVMTINPNKL